MAPAADCVVPYLGCSLPAALDLRFEVEHPFWYRGVPTPFRRLPRGVVAGRSRPELISAIQRGELAVAGLECPQEGWATSSTTAAVNRALDAIGAPQRVIAALWDGWGDLRPMLARSSTCTLEARTYHLVEVPRSRVSQFSDGSVAVGPSCWWDHDRTWVVWIDVDQSTTSIATCEERVAAAFRSAFRDGPDLVESGHL